MRDRCSFVTDPAEINRFQHLAVDKTRVHIPLIFGYDVIHGFRTIFPVPIAIGRFLGSRDGNHGAEHRGERSARGRHRLGICADAGHCSRPHAGVALSKGAGEDPYLGSAIAAAQVRGFQGDYIGRARSYSGVHETFPRVTERPKVAATTMASYIPESQMYNVYLPALSCRGQSWNRLGHERVHGPERCSRHGQSLVAA